MIHSTTSLTRCNECPNMLLCGDQGECMALVEQEKRKNRLAIDKLHSSERFALMFGRRMTKTEKQ